MGIKSVFCFAQPNVAENLSKSERKLNSQAMKQEMKARQVAGQAKEERKKLEEAASRNDVDAARHHARQAVALEQAEKAMKNAAAGAKQNALDLHIRGTQVEHLSTMDQVNKVLAKSKVQGALAEKIITDNKIFSEESKVTTANLHSMMFEDNTDQDVERQVQQALHNHKMRVADEARQQQQQLEEMMGPAVNLQQSERAPTAA